MSVSYVLSMESVIKRYRTEEHTTRIIRDTTERVYEECVDQHTIDLKRFKGFLREPGNMFNGLLYQAIGESIRTELSMTPDEFYFLFGQFAAIADPSFLDSAKILTVPTILWAVSVFNRGKNNVTDVREISTKVINVEGEKHGLSLVERLVLPTYSRDLLENFSRSDVDQILYQDFITTKGAYEGLAIAKGTTSSIKLVAPDYELTDIDFASRLFNLGIHPLKLLIRTRYGIGAKKPLKEGRDYKENEELYSQELGLRVPLYVRYVVDYVRTRASKEKASKSIADGLQVRFIQNLAVLQSRQEASNALRERAEEAEKRAKDAEEHAKQLAAQQTKFGHNLGNLGAAVSSLVDEQRRVIKQQNDLCIAGRYEEAKPYSQQIADLNTSIGVLMETFHAVSNALTYQFQERWDLIRQNSEVLDVEELCTSYLKRRVFAQNLEYETANRFEREKGREGTNPLVKVNVRFEPSDYRKLINKGYLLDAINNIVRNSLKKLEGRDAPEISLYGRVVDENIELIVEDNGFGADPETVDKINSAQPISRVEGRCIGIEVARNMAQFYGGTFRVQSEPDKYFRNIIVLPLGEKTRIEATKGSGQYLDFSDLLR